MSALQKLTFRVTGEVQGAAHTLPSGSRAARMLISRTSGVNFRSWTQKQATQLGIAGFVRNADDGAVEGEGIGEKQVLQKL